MNIIFCYLYRYSAHFKEYHELVFTNANQLPLPVIEHIITTHLSGGRWFIPDEWQLPNLFFAQGHTTTPPHHEFVQVKAGPGATPPEGDITLLLHTIQLNGAVHKVQ